MTTLLAELDVLALDCQATAPNPANGHLLEIGWSHVRASEPSSPIEAELFRLPEGAELPRRVGRVTGLDESALAAGLTPEKVWPSVVDTARSIAERNRETRCTTVIHFSRFEEPYLRWLEDRVGASFPLGIVCTHAIVRKLLPALPRRGLRAVAGYFGHSVSELRRASQHVAATAAVWRASVVLLEQSAGVHTLEELDAWLREPRSRAKPTRAYPMSPAKLHGLPSRPGVYRMLRGNGDVLYVGKATSLKQRVRSYFQTRAPHAEHILEMLTQARELEWTVTDSALEAALDEADTIKKLSPLYNKALRAGERSIVFATPALDHVSETPDGEHRLGPLASGDLWKALVLVAMGRQNELDTTPAVVLAVPESYAPGEAIFRSGFERFRAELGTTSLLAHGARLWRESLEDEVVEEEFHLEMQYDVGAERWTPERVKNHLGDVVKRAAHLVRRGLWLCLLSESTLVWNEPGGAEIALVIEQGRVRSRHHRFIHEQDATSAHAAPCRRFDERRRSFDLDTYDRLTVLTKEIRRLVSEDRPLRLHVGPSATLTNDQLRARLRWI
ncbi:MAG: hypothetical protein BMS9Abin37_0063 [Acidobacteriota bacterium]|nr:MAG: hypothetical protein BMS9Abin37_0063 [Acidobacteriota bacterium]